MNRWIRPVCIRLLLIFHACVFASTVQFDSTSAKFSPNMVILERPLKEGILFIKEDGLSFNDFKQSICMSDEKGRDEKTCDYGLNVISSETAQQYCGQINASAGDLYSTLKDYDVMDSYAYNQTTGEEIVKTSNPLTKIDPMVNYLLNLSGPVPILDDKFSFYTQGQYNTGLGPDYGRRWNTPQGFSGDSTLVNLSPSDRYFFRTSIAFRPTNHIQMYYRYYWNQLDKDRYNAPQYTPDSGLQFHRNSQTHCLSFNHSLSTNTFYHLKIQHYSSASKSYLYADPHKTPNYLIQIEENGMPVDTLDWSNNDDKTYFEEEIFERSQDPSSNLTYLWMIDPANPEGYVHPYFWDESSYIPFYRSTDRNRKEQNIIHWSVKLDIISRINHNHRIATGVAFVQHNRFLDHYTLQPLEKEVESGFFEEVIPFQPQIPSITSFFRRIYTRKPKQFSAYLHDKINFGNLLIHAGLRLDLFDANSVKMADPMDPSIYDPFLDEHIYKGWVEPDEELNDDEIREYRSKFKLNTPDERRALMHQKVKPKTHISPRIAISYPFLDQGSIFIGYKQFTQIPDFVDLYSTPDFKINSYPYVGRFSNPDLNMIKRSTYTYGVELILPKDIGLNLSGFYDRIQNEVKFSPLHETYGSGIKYQQKENSDENLKLYGIDIRIEKRYSSRFRASLDYRYQIYKTPSPDINVDQGRIRLIDDEGTATHRLNVNIMTRLNGLTASLIGCFQYLSFKSQNSSPIIGEPVGTNALKDYGYEPPGQKQSLFPCDLFLEQDFFAHSQFTHRVYLRIYNLFDQHDTPIQDSSTSVDPELYYDLRQWMPRESDAFEHRILQTEYMQRPREIWLGYRVIF